MAALLDLADDFTDDELVTRWPASYGGVAVVGGRARIDCDVAQWSGLRSAAAYTLTASQVHLRVWPPALAGASSAYLSVVVTTSTPGTDAGFNLDAGVVGYLLRAGFSDADPVFDTYDPTGHAWLRLRESAGSLLWETSPDGRSWTVRRTAATPAWAADADLALLCESKRDAGTDNFAEVDNVNWLESTVTAAGRATATAAGTSSTTRIVSGVGPATATAVAVTVAHIVTAPGPRLATVTTAGRLATATRPDRIISG